MRSSSRTSIRRSRTYRWRSPSRCSGRRSRPRARASVACTALALLAIGRAVARGSGSLAAGCAAAGLFAIGFGYAGAFLDLARVDACFVLLIALAAERLVAQRPNAALAWLALSVFAKQHGLLLLAAVSVALLLQGEAPCGRRCLARGRARRSRRSSSRARASSLATQSPCPRATASTPRSFFSLPHDRSAAVRAVPGRELRARAVAAHARAHARAVRRAAGRGGDRRSARPRARRRSRQREAAGVSGALHRGLYRAGSRARGRASRFAAFGPRMAAARVRAPVRDALSDAVAITRPSPRARRALQRCALRCSGQGRERPPWRSITRGSRARPSCTRWRSRTCATAAMPRSRARAPGAARAPPWRRRARRAGGRRALRALERVLETHYRPVSSCVRRAHDWLSARQPAWRTSSCSRSTRVRTCMTPLVVKPRRPLLKRGHDALTRGSGAGALGSGDRSARACTAGTCAAIAGRGDSDAVVDAVRRAPEAPGYRQRRQEERDDAGADSTRRSATRTRAPRRSP